MRSNFEDHSRHDPRLSNLCFRWVHLWSFLGRLGVVSGYILDCFGAFLEAFVLTWKAWSDPPESYLQTSTESQCYYGGTVRGDNS